MAGTLTFKVSEVRRLPDDATLKIKVTARQIQVLMPKTKK